GPEGGGGGGRLCPPYTFGAVLDPDDGGVTKLPLELQRQLTLARADVEDGVTGRRASQQLHHESVSIGVRRIPLCGLAVHGPVAVPLVATRGRVRDELRGGQSRYPAVTASSRNMRTVSSETSSRLRPRPFSLARRSCVTVMM